ncbi:MAG: insulinase family protein [Candidatus Cloacimonetes bacterium]|nr:insulinase family protein [Candidatus Cloacimonadota bacterium]
MKIFSKKLDNNLKVIFSKDNSNPLISIQLYIRTGSAQEDVSEAGFSHFTEHLVFKSTKNFPDNSIMGEVTFLGGHINAYTEYDSTCFYITIPAKFTKEALKIISEIAYQANFDEEHFLLEKKVVIEELKQYENEPEEMFIENIARSYLNKSPYRNPIIGNVENLEKANHNDLMGFYKKNYNPNNAFMVISGDFREDEILELVNQYFSNWEQSELAKKKIVNDEFPVLHRFISYPAEQNSDFIAFVHPDLAEINPDSTALSFAVKQFAMGKNSRLHKLLFGKEKLIDAIKVHSICGVMNGLVIILIYPKLGADQNKIINLIFQEWKKLLNHGMEEFEIIEQKREFLFAHKYSFEFVESLAFSIGNEELVGNYKNFLNYKDRINDLSQEKIKSAINKYMKLEQVYLYHSGKNKIKYNEISVKSPTTESLNLNRNDQNFYQHIFSNGLKVLFKRIVGKPTVGFAASFKVSQLYEDNRNRGINLLMAGLLMHGNEKQNYEQFLQFCSSNGINCGIIPSAETTTVHLKCFNNNIQLGLRQLANIINFPLFSNENLSNLKKTYISNLNRIKDYPHSYSSLLWKKMILGANSNLVNKEGSVTTMNSVSMKQLKKWHQKYYQPNNLAISIVGDFDFEKVLHQIEELFSSENGQTNEIQQNLILKPDVNKFRTYEKKMGQSYIHLGGFGCTAANVKKNTGFHVLAHLIGSDTANMLFDELREKKGLVYSTDFGFFSTQNVGIYQISAVTDKKSEKVVIKTIKEVLDRIKKNGITDNDLEKIKNSIRGNRLIEEESVLSQAIRIAILEIMDYGYQYYLDSDKRIDAVSIKFLHNLALEYFNDEKYYIHVLR